MKQLDEKRPFYPILILGIVLLYLLIPLLATALYSMATSWNQTILPEGLTLTWYADLFRDSRFIKSFWRSLALSLGTTVAAAVLIVPAIFSISTYMPKLERFIQAVIVIIFAMPGVIMAVGLLRAYSHTGISMVLIVCGAYLVSVLPFMYQGTRNSLRNVDAKTLMEAAELLGANRWSAFLNVVVPNILPGILVAALLSFSILFGEFVLINMVVGGRFETVQIYLYGKLSKSGHIASAIVVCYFLLMVAISALIVKLTYSKKGSRVT